jgi:hypothetical protein
LTLTTPSLPADAVIGDDAVKAPATSAAQLNWVKRASMDFSSGADDATAHRRPEWSVRAPNLNAEWLGFR